MIEIELNGKILISEEKAAAYLADMLDMPEYYGKDLDAIYDMLADITEETHVLIVNREVMQSTSFGSKLMWVFEDAAEDNNKLWLDWLHEDEESEEDFD